MPLLVGLRLEHLVARHEPCRSRRPVAPVLAPVPRNGEAVPARPSAAVPAPGSPAIAPWPPAGALSARRLPRLSTTPDRTHDPNHTTGVDPLSTPSAAAPSRLKVRDRPRQDQDLRLHELGHPAQQLVQPGERAAR
jgi:hypothetical protein